MLFANIIITIIGFMILLKCTDIFIDGAASLAHNFKIPTMVVGLTIVAFGTGAPEFAVSMSAHLSGNTEMILGNVIGSNIINILLILGLAALIKPIRISNSVIKKEIPLLALMTVGLSVLFFDKFFNNSLVNEISRSDGIILLLLFLVFVYYLISMIRRTTKEEFVKPKFSIKTSVVITFISLVGIIIGSNLIVKNVIDIAVFLGVSQKIISLTIIAFGTSLPELTTTLVAAKKGEESLAIGNIIGSNIFNICIVLGLPAAVLGGIVPISFNVIDLLVAISAVVMLFISSFKTRKIDKVEAFLFLIVLIVYYTYVFL